MTTLRLGLACGRLGKLGASLKGSSVLMSYKVMSTVLQRPRFTQRVFTGAERSGAGRRCCLCPATVVSEPVDGPFVPRFRAPWR
jgi:hypothetical protein